MGMSLAGGEGARERRRGRRPVGGERQGGTLCGLRARVTEGVLEGFTRSLGVMWCDNVCKARPLAELMAKALRKLPGWWGGWCGVQGEVLLASLNRGGCGSRGKSW